MIEVEIDDRSPVPAFEQLRAQIEQAIRRGNLPAGELLPTVRQLAADLAIAPNTVARAYRELEHAGLVRAQGRRGTTVNDLPQLTDSDRRHQLTAAVERLLDEATALGWTPDDLIAEIHRIPRSDTT